MRNRGHRPTPARGRRRRSAVVLALGLTSALGVGLVGPTSDGSASERSVKTFWAVTTDSSLLRFVLGSSSVSVSVADSCTSGELNSGTASVQNDHFELTVGPDNSSGRDLDTMRGTVKHNSAGTTFEILGTLAVNQHSPEVEGKQGSADTCTVHEKPFAAMPVQSPPVPARRLGILAGNTTSGKEKCTIGNNNGATGACQGTPADRLGFTNPLGLTVSPAGNVYFTDDEDADEDHDENTFGDYVQEVTSAGVAHTVPGTGDLYNPTGIVLDGAGDLYVAESGKLSTVGPNAVSSSVGGEIVKITPSGTNEIVAGDYEPCAKPPACGDGGPATQAHLTVPSGLAMNGAGDLYVADSGDNEVREISPSGIITRIAGDGSRCKEPLHCGDGGPAMEAELDLPTGLAINAAGDLFIAESGDLEIQEVTPAGTITRVAGDDSTCLAYLPVAGNCGNGGAATKAQLMPEIEDINGNCVTYPSSTDNIADDYDINNYVPPIALALDDSGNLYIADCDEIRRVSPAGRITRVLGGWPLPCQGGSCPGGTDPADDVVVAGVQGVVVHGSSLVFGVPAVNSDHTYAGYIATLKLQ
jgi:sugar lactone lactonase YvrE